MVVFYSSAQEDSLIGVEIAEEAAAVCITRFLHMFDFVLSELATWLSASNVIAH